MKPNNFFKVAAIIAAATVGDGIFALPYVFSRAGWLLGLFYLAGLGALVVLAHTVYLKTIEKVGEKERLLGLARRYLGPAGFWTGFVAIVVGLFLTLVAYLILGTQFVRLLVPSHSILYPLLLVWVFTSLTVILNDAGVVKLELMGIGFSSVIIIFIFVAAWPHITFSGIPAVNPKEFFLPFGTVLFALAGWTGIEPAYESREKSGWRREPWRALALGTGLAALLSVMFAAGIIGSASAITPDTASGLALWPVWKRDVFAVLGLLAVWTVFMPLSREIKNSLEKDLGWSKLVSRSALIMLPLALVLAGFNNFLVVVGLVGGLFLSTQYLLIISVGRRALSLPRVQNFFLDLVAALFVLAAIYSIWLFIVK